MLRMLSVSSTALLLPWRSLSIRASQLAGEAPRNVLPKTCSRPTLRETCYDQDNPTGPW